MSFIALCDFCIIFTSLFGVHPSMALMVAARTPAFASNIEVEMLTSCSGNGHVCLQIVNNGGAGALTSAAATTALPLTFFGFSIDLFQSLHERYSS